MSDVPAYPPTEHVLRDLRLAVENRPDDTASGWMPVTREIVTERGDIEPGALAMLVDVLGGGLSLRSVLPNWTATADLSLQLVGAEVTVGETVTADARVVRKGRTTVVTEVLLQVADRPLGWGSMTFAVLAQRDDTLRLDTLATGEVARTQFGDDDAGFAGSLLETIGVSQRAPGVVVMPFAEYVRNSLGAVQGGVLALLGAVAGRSALAGAPVLDLHVAYLALARVGPFVSHTEVLAPGAATVRLVDEGDDERLTTVIHVGTAA